MNDEILIGRTHVSEQDMQNALRGAFLEGFKEGVTISQRSMFASTAMESLLRQTGPDGFTAEQATKAFAIADLMVNASKEKRNANPTTGH